jgi:hypothetical protein
VDELVQQALARPMSAHFEQHKTCRSVTMNTVALDERVAAAFYLAFADAAVFFFLGG